ncbi:MAG TPA: hypothetical protein DCM87_00935 [Planctomycetes bacterium]|nr:hypothetical protein [Planctomycetota bacterium]
MRTEFRRGASLAAICTALGACLAARGAEGPAPFAVRPKEMQPGQGGYSLPADLQIRSTAKAKEKLWVLAEKLEGTSLSLRVVTIALAGVEAVAMGDVAVEARVLEVPPRPEGFVLEVSPKGFLVLGRDEQSIQWGLLCLREAMDVGRRFIPSCFVRDWPDVAWRGVHCRLPSQAQFKEFGRFVDEVLLPCRVNFAVIEVNYRMQFRSRREIEDPLAQPAEFCAELTSLLASRGMRAIPEFKSIGHQSSAARNHALLAAHPELDETPGLKFGDARLERRSWCPRHPSLPGLLFPLWSEIIKAFGCTHFHIGMDRVFLLAEEECPRCRRSSAWEILAAAIVQYHAFLRGKDNTVLMWGDRLLDASAHGYSRDEGSEMGTASAIAYLPRDIIICDWHAAVRAEYPSIAHFQREGFKILACPGPDPESVRSVWSCAQRARTPLFLGYMATTGVEFAALAEALFGTRSAPEAARAADALRLAARLAWQGKE